MTRPPATYITAVLVTLLAASSVAVLWSLRQTEEVTYWAAAWLCAMYGVWNLLIAWLVLGRTRWPWRVLSAFACEVTIHWVLTVPWRELTDLRAGLAVSAAVVGGLLLWFRGLGLSLQPPPGTPHAHAKVGISPATSESTISVEPQPSQASSSRWQFNVSHLLLLTVCCALILAMALPLRRNVYTWLAAATIGLLPPCITVALLLAVLCRLESRWSKAGTIGLMLLSACFIFLQAISPHPEPGNPDPTLLLIFMSLMLAQLIPLLLYRWCGFLLIGRNEAIPPPPDSSPTSGTP